MEKVFGLIADIGLEAAKERYKLRQDEVQAQEKLADYLARQKEYNFDCSLEEEIDFEGLAEYIRGNLMEDVKLRLFGTKAERQTARQTIADKAAYYAQAKTNMSKDRARHLAVTSVDILKNFYRNSAERNLLFVAAEIEDTIISEVTDQHKELGSKIDALEKSVRDSSILSVDSNVSLANEGKLDKVEKNLSALFAGLSTTHSLTPYYGFTMDGISHLKSIPLRPDAVELYPPRFEVKATAFKMGGVQLPCVDANTFARSYQTQSPIEFDVTAAQKYLGSVLDPAQYEAEKMAGVHMVLKPPAFPPAFPCSVLVDGETTVDYLLLRTKRIEEDGTAIFTNDEQKDFRFRVVLAVNTTTTSLNVSITPDNPSNAESLNYKRFLKKATLAKRVELKSLEHNVIIISSKANLVPHDYENLDSEIEFLEKVVAIEKHFQIALVIPEEIDVSDHQVIDRLYSMIADGKYCGCCGGFTMSFELTKELRQSVYDLGEIACSFSCKMSMKVELFNQELDFWIIRKIDCMRLESFAKTKKKLDALDDGDTLRIPFVSGDDGSDILYSDMFDSEEENG